MSAVPAAHPGEALLQVAAAEVLVDRLSDERPEESVAVLVALGVDLKHNVSVDPGPEIGETFAETHRVVLQRLNREPSLTVRPETPAEHGAR